VGGPNSSRYSSKEVNAAPGRWCQRLGPLAIAGQVNTGNSGVTFEALPPSFKSDARSSPSLSRLGAARLSFYGHPLGLWFQASHERAGGGVLLRGEGGR
jgi:hypothetical protein